jgi:predicted ATPase
MRLVGADIANYRSFASPQSINLAPVTLLYGENNSGKSALLRLFPLLADSCRDDLTTPLDFSSATLRGASFDDLRWRGRGPDDDPSVRIKLHWEGEPLLKTTEYEIGWPRELDRAVVRRFSAREALGYETIVGEWTYRAEDRDSTALTYVVTEGQRKREVRVRFRGLTPELQDDGNSHTPTPFGWQARALRQRVQWLGARRAPERHAPRPSGPRRRLAVDGSDVDAVLASNEEALREVSDWCAKNFGMSVAIEELQPKDIRLVLRNTEGVPFSVDVVDAGEGVAKVLPILAALAVARRASDDAPDILAVEEPESHLHPRLQRTLAGHIATWAMERRPARLVLETHSQHVLLGFQIAIARGQLRSEDVAVYWVHRVGEGKSVADRITIGEDGRLKGNWPSDVYTEASEMAAQLFEARWGKPGQAPP